jgi:hypothetical protein
MVLLSSAVAQADGEFFCQSSLSVMPSYNGKPAVVGEWKEFQVCFFNRSRDIRTGAYVWARHTTVSDPPDRWVFLDGFEDGAFPLDYDVMLPPNSVTCPITFMRRAIEPGRHKFRVETDCLKTADDRCKVNEYAPSIAGETSIEVLEFAGCSDD